MTQQPSTIDTIKDSASSVYETVSSKFTTQRTSHNSNKNTSNYTKDAHGNPIRKGGFKDQLNAAATGATPTGQEGEDGLVGKGVTALQQAAFEQGPERSDNGHSSRNPTNDTPPKRPDDDVKVEEFLRAQYKSGKSAKEIPKLGCDKN